MSIQKCPVPIFCLSLAIITVMASCSKTNVASPGDGGTGPSQDTTGSVTAPGIFYKLIHISNFIGDTAVSLSDTSLSSPAPATGAPCFFSLEDTTGRTSAYEKTNKWDLAFGNLYNSFLSGNNGTNASNYGHGNNAVGGIYIVEQPFDSVTDIPADNLFQTGADIYGTDDAGAFGTGIGWYFYDFSGGAFPGGDGQPHICYPLPNRTLIVRTGIGDYAKIRMISIYKNAPAAPTTFWPAPFFTFDYVLVPKGSTLFQIK